MARVGVLERSEAPRSLARASACPGVAPNCRNTRGICVRLCVSPRHYRFLREIYILPSDSFLRRDKMNLEYQGHVQRSSFFRLGDVIFAKDPSTQPTDGCAVSSRRDDEGSCSQAISPAPAPLYDGGSCSQAIFDHLNL